jgi:hypothetical protein
MPYSVKFKQSGNSRIMRASESARQDLKKSGATVVGGDVLIINKWETGKDAFEQVARTDGLFFKVEDLGQTHAAINTTRD